MKSLIVFKPAASFSLGKKEKTILNTKSHALHHPVRIVQLKYKVINIMIKTSTLCK